MKRIGEKHKISLFRGSEQFPPYIYLSHMYGLRIKRNFLAKVEQKPYEC